MMAACQSHVCPDIRIQSNLLSQRPANKNVGRKVNERRIRGFKLYGGNEPVSETPLGGVTGWKPTGRIAFKHSNGVVTEFARCRFR
jgi:hypothetical protein